MELPSKQSNGFTAKVISAPTRAYVMKENFHLPEIGRLPASALPGTQSAASAAKSVRSSKSGPFKRHIAHDLGMLTMFHKAKKPMSENGINLPVDSDKGTEICYLLPCLHSEHSIC